MSLGGLDDDIELPDYDNVVTMVSVDDVNKARNTELLSLKTGEKKDNDDNEMSEARKEALQRLMSMNPDRDLAIKALDEAKKNGAPNNVEMAANWMFEHPEFATKPKQITPMELDTASNTTKQQKATSQYTSKPGPDEGEGGGDTVSNNNNNNNGDNGDNGENIDYKEKCIECMGDTKECCINCWDTSSDRYDSMDGTEKKIFWGTIGGICCFGVLLLIILLPVSIRRVEFNEYAIRYDDLTETADSEEYNEGRYVFTPQTTLFIYDALIQKLSLELECLTRDGIVMDIDVDIQYSIPKTSVYDIWDEFGKEAQIDHYLKLVAADSIRDTIGSFPASDFYRNRFGIQLQIEDDLFVAMSNGKTHLLMNSAVLAGYGYPDSLKTMIKSKRESENDIEIAKNERDGNLTDAATTYVVAKVNAHRLYIQGQAEVESLLNEADAHANAVRARFDEITYLFQLMKDRYDFTGKQFIDYWLTSFVLLDATNPITTTLVPTQEMEMLDNTLAPTIEPTLEPTMEPTFEPTIEPTGNNTMGNIINTTTINTATTEYFTSASPTDAP